jgi:hypothetical protein
MENLIIHNVEITTTQHYNRWLDERWGVPKSHRHNSSEPLISNQEARRLCETALIEATAEDQKLFDVVSWALRETGAASISGAELVRFAGPSLLESLPRNATPPFADPRRDGAAPANLLVAENPARVAMYLAKVSVAVPGSATVEAAFSADFSVAGHAQACRLDGWARPEAAFTWTAAHECQIKLPPLAGDGKFIFRLVGSPYVSKGRLPSQQIEILVDGELLGMCQVRDVAVLECEIPRRLLENNEPIVVTLNLPTAACPRDVSGADDDRILALAVRSIAVLRVTASKAIAETPMLV